MEETHEKSRLQTALDTPIEELSDEQKALLVENRAALTEAEVTRFVEAGILEAAPEEGGEAGAAA